MRNGRLIDAGYFTIAILAESPELVNIQPVAAKEAGGTWLEALFTNRNRQRYYKKP